MKRFVALSAGLCLVLGLLAAPAAATSAAPTISGPGQVPYWSTVTLTGTAGQDATVTVYFRDTAGGTFRPERDVTADASGNYSTTYTAGNDYEYYAVANGLASPIRRTAIVGSTCTTSGPAFRNLPVTPWTPNETHYAAFTATRNGEWAGVAYASDPWGTFAVITWRPGHPLAILGRYDYPHGTWSPAWSVRVVGITSGGAVVAMVQNISDSEPVSDYGVAWVGSHRYVLAHSSSWTTFEPVGVSDSGLIAGWAQTGSGSAARYYAIRWSGPTGGYKVVGTSGTQSMQVVIDSAGDVAWSDQNSQMHLVTPAGVSRTLQQPAESYLYPEAAAGPYIYTVDSNQSVARWDTADTDPIPLVPVTAPSHNAWLQGAGVNGTFVTGVDQPRWMRTGFGAYVRIPTEYTTDIVDPTGFAIDASGTLAFTAKDGLVHFFSCRPVNGSAGRAGRSDVVADVNGDHRADLLATKPDGTFWYWLNTGNATQPFGAGAQIGSGWSSFTTILAGDVNGDGRADLLATKPDGTLWYWPNTGSAGHPFGAGQRIGSGWNGFTTVLAGDVNGDGRADLLATKPDGTLWYWPNTGNASHPFGAGHQIGSGWTDFTTLTLGDLNGDHAADLIAVLPNGELTTYLNTGSPSAPYATGMEIGVSGWTAPTHLAAGDVNGDGLADLLATSPTGALTYYPNSGTTGAPFTSGAQVGSGWQTFNRLF